MEKLVYDPSQKPILIKVFQSQIDDLKFQLRGLYSLLGQIDITLVDPEYLDKNDLEKVTKISSPQSKRVYAPREGTKDYFNKVKEVLELAGEPLTSRGILTALYEYHPDEFNIDDDRKNIASLSAILSEKEKENKIERTKPDVGHAVFSLPKKYKQENKQQATNIILASKSDDTESEVDDWVFEETKKVEPDDDDLPF